MFNSVTNTSALAADVKLDTFGEKAAYALENSLLGVLIVFAVLVLLSLVVKLVASILTSKEKKAKAPAEKAVAPAPAPAPVPAPTAASNDGEIVAAITAAISLMLEAEGKDPHGFRVVSFRRSSTRKNSL
jgi:sodium pump decarboxylase gamma subunit